MSMILPRIVPPASTSAMDASAHPRWSFERLFWGAIVIAAGMAAGWLIAVLIGLATGWIDFQIC